MQSPPPPARRARRPPRSSSPPPRPWTQRRHDAHGEGTLGVASLVRKSFAAALPTVRDDRCRIAAAWRFQLHTPLPPASSAKMNSRPGPGCRIVSRPDKRSTALPPPTAARMLEWRNWQTHWTQNPAPVTGHEGSSPSSSTTPAPAASCRRELAGSASVRCLQPRLGISVSPTAWPVAAVPARLVEPH